MRWLVSIALVWLLAAPAVAQDAEAPERAPDTAPEPDTEPDTAPGPDADAEPDAEPAPEVDPDEVESPEDVDWAHHEPTADHPPIEEAEPEPEPASDEPAWTEAPASAAVEPEPGDESYGDGEHRDAIDYSGRGEPPLDPADGVLWIPRVLFSPLYLISEYVLRQPIGWLVAEVERSHLIDVFFDAFTWEDRQAGILPTVFFDFGFLPSVGLYMFWNDVGMEGNQIRASVGFWGPDWLSAKFSDRIMFDDDNELSIYVAGLRRPDYIWHGGRWDVDVDQRARFSRDQLGGGFQFINRPWRASEIRYLANVEWNEFSNSSFSDDGRDGPIERAAAQGWFDLPDGYTTGFVALRHRLQLSLDTREERPAPGHGARIQGWFEQGVDLLRPEELHWLRYGGRLGAFADLGEQRVLQVMGYVDLADPVGSLAQVPFTEQIWLGREPMTMGGFLPGTLVGRSAAVLALEYHYPIWVWLEGSVHYSVGNAFGDRFEDFHVERLRQSFGFGFRTVGDRDNSALIMLAFGTEPFVHGASVTSVRFVIGSEAGF